MRLFVAVVLGLLNAIPLLTQTRGVVQRYTLKDCIAIALERNFDIRDVNARSLAAAAGLTSAFGTFLPSADINAGYNRQLTNLRRQFSYVNGVPILGDPIPNNYTLSGTLNWTIFNGFLRESNYDIAQRNVDASEQDIRYQRLNVSYTITRQFFEVLRAAQVLKARQENLALSRSTFDRIKALYENGRAPITQLLSQETEVANQETSVLSAEIDHDKAKVTLLTTMAVNPNQAVEIDAGSVQSEVEVADVESFRMSIGSEETSVERAMEQRPDVAASKVRANAAQAGVAAASAAYYPTFSAVGGYSWNYIEISNFDTQGRWFMGLNFRMPVFDQFRTNKSIEDAKLIKTQRDLDVERLKQQIQQSVHNAYLTLASAEKSLSITERALKSATTSMDAMQERFNVGGATLLDVQTANNQLITARINRVAAVYSYLDARTLVEFATGLYGEP